MFSWNKKSGGAQHHKKTNYTRFFISNCINDSDVLDWTCLCIISDCRNSFNNKLNSLWTNKGFLTPANTQPSSEESFKEKRKMFIFMCSLFTSFNMQMLNLCHRWHRHIHNPLKYVKWSVLQNQLTAKNSQLFSQNVSS